MYIGDQRTCHRCANPCKRVCDACLFQGKLTPICADHRFHYRHFTDERPPSFDLCTAHEAERVALYNRMLAVAVVGRKDTEDDAHEP